MTPKELKQLRTAVADYMRSEGCSCCRDCESHRINHARLGKLLKIKKHKGYYNFTKFQTP